MYACIQVIKIFLVAGRTGQPEVVQEVLADLKRLGTSLVKHLSNSTSESSLANITQSVSDQGKAIIGIGSDKVLFINH